MIPEPGDGWVRLSPRKLLLDPVKTLGQFIVPALVAAVTAAQSPWFLLVAPFILVIPVVIGVVPWFVTYYLITDTQFQLRGGLLNKKTSTAPLDRVRSVDLEASVLHRILGVTKVMVGTGVDDERITLDALEKQDAAALRASLLRLIDHADAPAEEPLPWPTAGHGCDPDSPVEGLTPGAAARPPAVVRRPEPAEELAAIDWSWLRFAPFSLTKLVVLAGALGALSQFGDELPIYDEETIRSVWEWVTQFALVVIVPVLFVGALVLWLVVSVGGYVIQWWDFRLSRERGNLHLTSGLLTTRSVTVEEAKVRGVELSEPLLLRAVGGGELATLSTGLEHGITKVLPPCPRDVVVGTGARVLGEESPMTTPLVPHGPVARRRSWIRHVRWAAVVAALAAIPVAVLDVVGWGWWAVAAVLLLAWGAVVGESAYRHLGHALTDRHLVAGSGDLQRVRTVLETEGIIGWVVDQTWFQRRVGLATLTATTAAGSERVVVLDIALDRAVAFADATTPGMLTPFLLHD